MTDLDISSLARQVSLSPDDPWVRYRWRVALVRAGRGQEAGFEKGDTVEVELGGDAIIEGGEFAEGTTFVRQITRIYQAVPGMEVEVFPGMEVAGRRSPWRVFSFDRVTLVEPARPAS